MSSFPDRSHLPAFARTWSGSIQILTPEQKFDGVITSCHIRFHAAQLMQCVSQQILGDRLGINQVAGKCKAGVGNDVGPECRILFRFSAVA